MTEKNMDEKSNSTSSEGKAIKDHLGNACTAEFNCLLEEWKSLSTSDANDDIWSSQKENFLFVAAFTSFGFAAKFTNEGRLGMVVFASLLGVLLLVFNFIACEGINRHQFARRRRLKEIEEKLPISFYSRQRELMNLASNDVSENDKQSWSLVGRFNRMFLWSSRGAMNIGLRRLRFAMILVGFFCSFLLIIMALLKG